MYTIFLSGVRTHHVCLRLWSRWPLYVLTGRAVIIWTRHYKRL